MATLVYLDVEDEITSAATRIRTATEPRVALVIPYGSRLATSRMNFRLLAREALVNGRRLDIVTPDASTRALAASAGLPVFGSVGEYESALEGPEPGPAPGDGAPGDGPTGTDSTQRHDAPAIVPGTPRVGTPRNPSPGGTEGHGGREDERPPDHGRAHGSPRVVRPARSYRPGAGLAVGVGILALALVVAAVAAWLVLPEARITVTPRLETIGPIDLTVRADPEASSVDPAGGVIPAITLQIPLRTQGEFTATGVRVEETNATGSVRWSNCDPTRSYTIPSGTVVRTQSDQRFRTDSELFLPVAIITGSPENPQLQCQANDVGVTANQAGPGGNVAAGAITIVPSNYNRTVVRVTNPAPTSGGARTEFPRVVQADVDAALVSLRAEIDAQFVAAVDDPVGAPAGATVFRETAVLGEVRTDVDPATLVGLEATTFALQMAADGTVQVVDEGPLQEIAESRLVGSVAAGYELVEGSSVVEIGRATVVDGVVSFPVRGWAQQRRPLDGEALAVSVLGLSRDEAQALLAPYGRVEIVLWPDWVTTVPTLAQRVTFTVNAPSGPPLPTPAPPPTPAPTPEPSGDAGGEEPVPSPS